VKHNVLGCLEFIAVRYDTITSLNALLAVEGLPSGKLEAVTLIYKPMGEGTKLLDFYDRKTTQHGVQRVVELPTIGAGDLVVVENRIQIGPTVRLCGMHIMEVDIEGKYVAEDGIQLYSGKTFFSIRFEEEAVPNDSFKELTQHVAANA